MHKVARWFALSALVIVLDQWSKTYFNSAYQYGEIREVIPGLLNFVLAYNPGAAFSFLADAGGWQKFFFTGLAFAVSGWLGWQMVRGAQSGLMNLASALIIGGALGNVIDRLIHGHVIDFIQVYYQAYYWPAFNIADSAICAGGGADGAGQLSSTCLKETGMSQPIQVLLANPRGFCAGVDRAIAIVERALAQFGAPIYVRHEVVHNKFVVNNLREQGAIFIEELSDVPPGSTLIYSAHGVPLSVRAEAESRGLRVFDATCPAGDQGACGSAQDA